MQNSSTRRRRGTGDVFAGAGDAISPRNKVHPESDLVVVLTGEAYYQEPIMGPHTIIGRYVPPALHSPDTG